MLQKLLLLKLRFTKVIKAHSYFFCVIFTRRFFGATQKLELHFSFKPTTLLKLYSKMVIFWENFKIFEKATSSITEAYLEPNRKSMMDFLAKTFKTKSSIADIWRGSSKCASALVMNFPTVFFCSSTLMGKW